jgi:hypothetical protein
MTNQPAAPATEQAEPSPLQQSLSHYTRVLDEATLSSGQRLAGRLALPLPVHTGPEMFQSAAIKRLCDGLLEQRLLILHGATGVPAMVLAGRVAQAAAEVAKVPAMEVDWTVDEQATLDALLLPPVQPAIILMHAGRRALGWASDQLLAALASSGCYLLLVSDAPQEAWHLARNEQSLWFEQTTSELFNPTWLGLKLRSELAARVAQLPPAVRVGLAQNPPLLGGVPLAELGPLLGTPLHIAAFVRSLSGSDLAASVAELVAATARRPVDELGGAIFEDLNRDERLLALGLCLQNELFEAALFRRLETLLEHVWGERQANGALIDDDDFKGMTALFNAMGVAPRRRFVPRYLNTTRQILAAAAPTYGRHVRRATLWLASEELEGTVQGEERARQRATAIVGLSDAALADFRLAEEALLLLIAHNSPLENDFVSLALARWYELGAGDALFALTKRWRSDGEVAGAVGKLTDRIGIADGVAPRDRLTANCVLACAYATRIERPGQLRAALLGELRALVVDAGPLTRRVIRERVLPLLLPAHIINSGDLLRDMSCYDDLRQSISDHLVRLYRRNRRDVARMFAHWLNDAEREATPYADGNPPSIHDAALTTMALTLSRLEPDVPLPPREGQSVEDLLRQPLPDGEITLTSGELALPLVRRMLAQKRHPMVADAVRSTMIRQGRYNDELLDELLANISETDSENTVRVLTATYLEERASLPGGDGTIVVEGRTYPVFLAGTRPKTGAEMAVGRWLADGKGGPAREIALRASTAFVEALDVYEAEAIRDNAVMPMAVRTAPPTAVPAAEPPPAAAVAVEEAAAPAQRGGPPAKRNDWNDLFGEQFVPVFVTLDAPEHRATIRELLPLARQLRDHSPKAVEFLLEDKWPGYNSAVAEEVAERLSNALALSDKGWNGLTLADGGRTVETLYTVAKERNQLWLFALAVVVPALVVLVILLMVLFVV